MIGKTKEQRIKDLRVLTGVYEESGVIELTPELAAKLIEYNVKNRQLYPCVVAAYAKQMRDGKWHRSNDAVSFDNNGHLSNGQHRLLAVVNSGVTITVIVAFGVDNHPEMDRGKKRSAVDNVTLGETADAFGLSDKPDLIRILAKAGQISKGKCLDPDEINEILPMYGQALLNADATGMFRGKVFKRQAVNAALFGAYVCGIDCDIIIRVRQVLESSITTDPLKDAPIIALREKLYKVKGTGYDVDIDIYRRVIYAIKAIERGSERKISKADNTDIIIKVN